MEPNTVMLFVWIGLMVAFTVIEAVTVQLVTIWFAVGSLVALIANIAGANIVVQWLIFVAVSAVCLLATRQGAANQCGSLHWADGSRDRGN